ncbi:MAG: RNA polymerase sigma factor [Brevundimonas sp.]
MVTDSAARLRGHLVEKYETLLSGLSARLGSREMARDALQDAYVKLSSNGPQDEVRHPTAYLFRMALNIAANARRRDRRLLGFDEVAALLDVPDESPDPATVAEARSDLATVKAAMARMPARRLAICTAAWLDGLSTAEIAEQNGVAQRTVQHELKLATEALQKNLAQPKVISLRRSEDGVS